MKVMVAKKTRAPRIQEVTADDLEAVAESIEGQIGELRSYIERMRERKIPELVMTGFEKRAKVHKFLGEFNAHLDFAIKTHNL